MHMDFSLMVFWSVCKIMYNIGEKIKIKKKEKKKKKKKKKITSKSDLNVIFGQVLVECEECGSQD